jgi:Uma2 family endonuclease
MRAYAKQQATYEDLKSLPESMVGEIINGELFATPRPNFGHARASSVLGVKIGGPFDSGDGGPGGWWIIYEPELHVGKDILVPDLAGWRRSRMPKPPAPTEPFVTLAPDWVCEILSPSTARLDFERKLPIYGREQVQHVWFINPQLRALEVFRRLEPRNWMLAGLFAGDMKIRAEPFDAVEWDLGSLWLPEEPAPAR